LLPSDLLRVRVRGGEIKPVYATIASPNLQLARELVEIFATCVGRKKGVLLDEVREREGIGFDYRFVRGLSTLLERRSVFETHSTLDPTRARRLVFEEAGRRGALSHEARERVLAKVAKESGITAGELSEDLWSDLDEELILKEFKTTEPDELLKHYNLSLTQTLLFKSTALEFTARSNWKRIFRMIKYLGLMYTAECDGQAFRVAVDGPLSAFKLTERYGTSLARLLPTIVASDGWTVKADIVRARNGSKRIYRLNLDQATVGFLIAPEEPIKREPGGAFDSSVEESFSRRFQSLGLGWKLTREPEPLIAGRHVMIPDFGFEKNGMKTFLEVVGFWTPSYLDRKLKKLAQLEGVDMLVAVNRGLACSKLKRLHIGVNLFLYDRDVPLQPVVNHLRYREEKELASQVKAIAQKEIEFDKPVVDLGEESRKLGTSEEALTKVLQQKGVKGYTLIGETLVADAKLVEIKRRIKDLPHLHLPTVIRIIEAEGVRNPYKVLEAMGYVVRWRGLDIERAEIQEENHDQSIENT